MNYVIYKTKQISDPEGNPLSYSRLYDWKLSLQPSLGPRGVSRQVNSAFFQLKLGHGYIKGYLNKLGHTENDLWVGTLAGYLGKKRRIQIDCALRP
ncbi:hypothetical protein M433DRAFT_9975 [Acidomyces richmondensis BFW]|nr:hypothetical protein M433DRAFT_9975 [Acidomyces richmondensis BFW]